MTWKPRPPGAAPSPWIPTNAAAPTCPPSAPRASTHGPTPVSSGRESTTSTPAAVSRSRVRSATSQVKACSGYPASVDVPVVLQGFVPLAPSGTGALIAAGSAALPPLCPGSSTTTGGAATGAGAGGGAAGDGEADGDGDGAAVVVPGTALAGPAAAPASAQPVVSSSASARSTRRRPMAPACHARCRRRGLRSGHVPRRHTRHLPADEAGAAVAAAGRRSPRGAGADRGHRLGRREP